MRAKTYPITTINGTIELDIAGDYFKLMIAAAAVDVELLSDGNQALKADGATAGFYQRIPFNKVRITHTGVQAITILVAPQDGGSDNFTGTFTAQGTLGTLAQKLASGLNSLVISAAPADWLTDDDRAFMAWQTVGAVAAQVGHCQVKNPPASGKTVYVDGFFVSGGAVAESFRFGHKDADLTTDGGAIFFPTRNAGAVATAHIRQQNNAASLLDSEHGKIFVLANDSKEITFAAAIKLAAGEGYAVMNATVNTPLVCTFKIREY